MKGSQETVCAVVVTYNRKQLLIECLQGLLKQTHLVDGIFVIDNASTDGTPELLSNQGFLDSSVSEDEGKQEVFTKTIQSKNGDTTFYYLRLNENLGGAGGFHEGVKRAFLLGFDWLWLMDDDVEPLHDALEKQLHYRNISKCIHPSKQYLNGERYLWEGSINELDGFEYFKDDEFTKYERDFTVVNFGNFEGMLIHRDIVSKIGFPRQDLFMIGDDTIYGYQASKYTLNIYIKDICFLKKLDGRGKMKSILKRYLDFRNKYASFFRKISQNKFYWFLSFISITMRKLGSSIIKRRRPLEFYYILRGCIDGLRENYDNNIVRKLLR